MHRLLERQIKRLLPPDVAPGVFGALLAAVDDAYESFDSDRKLSERSMEIASAELLERNKELVERNSQLQAAHADLQTLHANLKRLADELEARGRGANLGASLGESTFSLPTLRSETRLKPPCVTRKRSIA